MQLFQICGNLVSRIRHDRLKGNFKFRVKALVGKEGSDCGFRLRSVVVCELCKGEKVDPVILLVIAVYTKVLLQDLIDPFGLAIGLWVVSSRKVGLDV